MGTVRLTVGDEMEAATLCGLLRTNGIRCAFRRTDIAAAVGAYGAGFAMAGPTEILVDDSDLDAARAVFNA
jgi:hypothetical protein